MHIAARTAHLKESVIREMTRVALGCGAINLSQGFPDYDPPPEVLEAATAAIHDGLNQYSMSWGLPVLRQRLAERYRAMLGRDVDPDRHVVVTCGVTEAIACAFFAVLDRRLGGALTASLQAGLYPQGIGEHQIFVNGGTSDDPWRAPRPRAAIASW